MEGLRERRTQWGRWNQQTERWRRDRSEAPREAESECGRESGKHSCLLLVLALRSLESVLSAASLPKSSLTPETWTKLSFGPFVIALKGCTTPFYHTFMSKTKNIKRIYQLGLFVSIWKKHIGGVFGNADKHTLWPPYWSWSQHAILHL